MKRIKRFIHTIPLIMAVLVLISSFIVGGSVGSAYASASAKEGNANVLNYTNVLDDLHKDEAFDMREYPAVDNDYSLQVIQIAESTAGELFIYVYQPSANVSRFPATYVNMALAEKVSNGDTSYVVRGDEFSGQMVGGGHGGGGSGGRSSVEPIAELNVGVDSYQLHSLTLVSCQEVFAKYRVGGIIVSSDTERYYNIASIYREWDGFVDDPADKDNTISQVAYKVGQLWTVTTSTGVVEYTAKDIEVVQLTSQMIGIHRYYDGFQFDGTKSLDSHYIAFTCDHKIDKLLSADLEFDTRTYRALAGSGTEYGELEHHRVTLYDYQVVSNDGSGWFGQKEEWHRVTSVKEFIQEVELTDDEERDLLSYEWILNFYESEFKNEAGGKDVLISGLLPFGFVWTIVNACTTTGELVFDVSLLRLEFKYEGKIYNLGVVSDISTGSNKPLNGNGFDFLAWLEEVTGIPKGAWIAILCLIPIAIVLPILSVIFPVVGKVVIDVVWYLGIGIWWIISAPFKALYWLCKKIFRLED